MDQNSFSIEFFVNQNDSFWGTANKDWAQRNERLGTTSQIITVAALDFASLLSVHGIRDT